MYLRVSEAGFIGAALLRYTSLMGYAADVTLHFLSRREIADYLGVSLNTVKTYKHLPPPDVSVGRNRGWSKATIDAWLAQHPRLGSRAHHNPSTS